MRSKRAVIHVAEVEIRPESGMGRVAWHWKQAFERRGYEFIHIGLSEAGKLWHPTVFPKAAYSAYQRLGKQGDLFLVHEPASAAFVKRGIPTVVFSHGLERRGAQLMARFPEKRPVSKRIRSMLTAPLWRLRSYSCDKGLRNATAALLINQEDAAFARSYYGLTEDRCFVFENGVNFPTAHSEQRTSHSRSVLFLGSWLKRKGTEALARTAALLHARHVAVDWVLAGTGRDEADVLAEWPVELRAQTTVIPKFPEFEEPKIFSECGIFVLPSLFEGQPLSLLQAMSYGKCCIASNCCGQKDLIQHGLNGFLHEPNDAEGLAALIQKAIEYPTLVFRLGQNAARSVADRSWETVSDKVVSYVETLLQMDR